MAEYPIGLKCDNCGEMIVNFPCATLHYSKDLALHYCSRLCLDDLSWLEK